MPSTTANRDWLPLALGTLGILLHLLIGYFYLAAGLIAPLGGIIVLWAIWAVLLAVGVWLLLKHPLFALLVPAAALVLFFIAIMLGGALFGWTA